MRSLRPRPLLISQVAPYRHLAGLCVRPAHAVPPRSPASVVLPTRVSSGSDCEHANFGPARYRVGNLARISHLCFQQAYRHIRRLTSAPLCHCGLVFLSLLFFSFSRMLDPCWSRVMGVDLENLEFAGLSEPLAMPRGRRSSCQLRLGTGVGQVVVRRCLPTLAPVILQLVHSMS